MSGHDDRERWHVIPPDQRASPLGYQRAEKTILCQHIPRQRLHAEMLGRLALMHAEVADQSQQRRLIISTRRADYDLAVFHEIAFPRAH